MSRPRTWKTDPKICEWCEQPFTPRTKYQAEKQRYCGHGCKGQALGKFRRARRIIKNCLQCGATMYVKPWLRETKNFCSNACSTGYRSQGEDNHFWKGGDAYYWKRKARERDNQSCQYPGCGLTVKDKRMHAHHKIPRSIGGPDDLENLITMCAAHHHKVERLLMKELMRAFPKTTKKILLKLYAKHTKPTQAAN